MRMHGYSAQQSMDNIRSIRHATYNGVGAHRIGFFEERVLPIVLKQIKNKKKGEDATLEELEQMESEGAQKILAAKVVEAVEEVAQDYNPKEASPLGNEEVKEEEEEEKTQTKS